MQIDDVLSDFLTEGGKTVQEFGKNSKALATAAQNTLQITERAARDLAAGTADLVAAQRIAQRSFEQLKTIARAEGNLIAAATVGWLEGTVATILKIIDRLF